MRVTRVWWTAAALCAAASVAGSSYGSVAAALEPGVHVDPGSPAAKEYALPLNQARQTGQEGSEQSSSSGTLFGAGLSPKRSQSASVRAGAHRDERRVSAHEVARARSVRAPVGARASGALTRQRFSHADGDSMLALLGGGVLVLVLGAFLGVVLRGRRTAHSN